MVIKKFKMWHFIPSISSVPTDREVHLAVVDHDGIHVLDFPCCWNGYCWIHAETKVRVDVHPTHWREWSE
jgi:hypothetical protein